MTLLGVDFGERRVGIAKSDPTDLIAGTWGILERTPHTSNHQVAERIAALAGELGARGVVLGLPLDAGVDRQGIGYQARRVRRFAALLEELLDVPLILWDESLTSVDAEELLAQRGRRSGRRRHLDDVAAATMLQSYLDRHRP
jgi:putative Holliday junction resolvase